jgi:hypothetical protein
VGVVQAITISSPRWSRSAFAAETHVVIKRILSHPARMNLTHSVCSLVNEVLSSRSAYPEMTCKGVCWRKGIS